MFQAQRHVLAGVGDGAAADGDDQVGLGCAGYGGGAQHGVARDMGRHVVVGGGVTLAQGSAQLADFIGLVVERVADQQEHALRIEALGFFQHHLDKRAAEKYAFHRRNVEYTFSHDSLLR